jgi:hypothetical protein
VGLHSSKIRILQGVKKMTEKVRIPRKVAEAIEYLLSHKHYGYTKEKLLVSHAEMEKYPKRYWTEEARPLNNIGLLVLAEVLVNGYEVEKEPEDMLLKEYKSMNGAATPKTEFGRAAIERRKGFLTALDILGVKVEGVNT